MGNVDASLLIRKVLKKVASANAAFFVSKLLQEREQCQDCLNQVEYEHQPFVHEVFKLKFWSGADETLQSIDKSLSL